MEDHQSSSSRTIQHDMHLASRKAEETALRRYQAAGWLESFIGPASGLSSSKHPSEVEFVSRLKNGLVLCNLINKIQPGSVPKVIESSPSTSLASILDGGVQPLLAYQYFENVRNFLVAVKELNLPAFEASDLEMVSLVGGSSAKIVDCVLALKGYHEWKQWKGDTSGFHKHTYTAVSSRSPMVPLLAGNSRNLSYTAPGTPSGPRRQLDMSSFVINDEVSSTEAQNCKTDEDSLVAGLAQCLVNMKENVDQNLLDSFHHGNLDSVKLFSQIMPDCLQEHQVNQVPEECLKKGKYKHQLLLKAQERELMDLKKLLASTKKEVEVLQLQFQSDLKQIGSQVQELASAALGYGRVVKENRDLYNMVQDLKEAESVELGAVLLNKENNEVRELRKQVEILKASLARKEEQTVKDNQIKEHRSTWQMISKVETENTPPRSRRLSIESCTAVKTDKVTNLENRKGLEKSVVKTKVMTENTPPRSRRLSIESCTAVKTEKVTNLENRKGMEKSVARTKMMTENTPPRSRRLSIESCTAVKTEKATNSENRKGLEKTVAKTKPGIEYTPQRFRRLSLEGPTSVKDLQFKTSEKEIASRLISGTFKKEGNERIHPVQQILKTPERATCRKSVVQIVSPSDFGFSTCKYQTPNVSSAASKKPSQIRKSLKTIGKFISGSERRNQQEYPKATQLPSNGNVNVDNVKSPLTASSRPLRRQSLTGAQISGVSRRSSLGGKSVGSFANETRRNAVTPPPMHKDKRWL
ncbi:hypothetical protein MKX01_018544 [Papaver californicum]|nr:hypothetical protein MKX01_018544 [Papaver californicum]